MLGLTDWPWCDQASVPLILTHPPPAWGFESCSSHSGHSSKTPPLSWGSTLFSSQMHMLQQNTAAALPLRPSDAFWGPQCSCQGGKRVFIYVQWSSRWWGWRPTAQMSQTVCVQTLRLRTNPLPVFILIPGNSQQRHTGHWPKHTNSVWTKGQTCIRTEKTSLCNRPNMKSSHQTFISSVHLSSLKQNSRKRSVPHLQSVFVENQLNTKREKHLN